MKRTAYTAKGAGPTTILRRRPVNPSPPLKPPPPTNGLFYRALVALDMDVERMAKVLGTDTQDALSLAATPDTRLGDHVELSETLLDHVNTKLGMFIALRSELHAHVAKHRQVRAARREAIKGKP